MPKPKDFSKELSDWLNSDRRKTVKDLEVFFGEKTFAIAIFLLMALPALPIPTGGVSHIFEALAISIASGMTIGLKTLWIPKRWEKLEIGGNFQQKALILLIKLIKFFEKFSKPRWPKVVTNKQYLRLIGVIIIIFCLAAFFSPPFSGLDTLPALGVVIICLSIILEDVLLSIIGLVVGSIGIALTLTIGATAFKFFEKLF
jgi:hypothetical protein